jgi:hypothetical protein
MLATHSSILMQTIPLSRKQSDPSEEAVVRIFREPPPGGTTLFRAAVTLTSVALRERYDQAQRALDDAGGPGRIPGTVRAVEVAHSHARRALFADVLDKLRSGRLQAIAMELRSFDAVYHEVAAAHWNAFEVINWKRSTVRRPGEKSPMFHVFVYAREAYDGLISPDVTKAQLALPATLASDQTLKVRIREEFNATTPDIRAQWRTKTEAALYIRNRVDNRGGERQKRRHVLKVLAEEFALRFPDAPDGKTEK